MNQSIAAISLLVRDYDEALDFYVSALGFELVEDNPLLSGQRWVVVRPPGTSTCNLLLAQAKNAAEVAAVGQQAGGRVLLFLHTDDFERDYHAFRQRGVRFLEVPRHEAYGTVAVFEDLYGTKWDLLEPAKTSPSATS